MTLKIILSTLTGGLLATLLEYLIQVWNKQAGDLFGVPSFWAMAVGNLLIAFLLSVLFQRWLDAWGFWRGAFHASWIAGLFAGAFNLRYVSSAQINPVYLTLLNILIWGITGGLMGFLLQKMRGHARFRW